MKEVWWLTLVVAVHVAMASPVTVTSAEPCYLGTDPTLGDLVLYRLCMEAMRDEVDLSSLLSVNSVHVLPQGETEVSDWLVSPDGVTEEFPYCYSLTPEQCQVLKLTLDDILRLFDGENDGDKGSLDEPATKRLKRSTPMERLLRLYRARKLGFHKRFSAKDWETLAKFARQRAAIHKPNRVIPAGRNGRSVSGEQTARISNTLNNNVTDKNAPPHNTVDQYGDAQIPDDVPYHSNDGEEEDDEEAHRVSKRSALTRLPPNVATILASYKRYKEKFGYGKAGGYRRWG